MPPRFSLTLPANHTEQPKPFGTIGDVTEIPDALHNMLVAWNSGSQTQRDLALDIAAQNYRASQRKVGQ